MPLLPSLCLCPSPQQSGPRSPPQGALLTPRHKGHISQASWRGPDRQQPPWQKGLRPQTTEPTLIHRAVPGRSAERHQQFTWKPELSVCPGVNRHFHMICIRDKFSQNIGRQVPSKVIWDHLSTMYDMQALHESEILPFPNPERNFVLPEEIIHEVREGKVVIEEEMKEEMKEDVDPHSGADDVFSSSGSLGKATEKSSKDKNSSDLGSKEGADKRKRTRPPASIPPTASARTRRRSARAGVCARVCACVCMCVPVGMASWAALAAGTALSPLAHPLAQPRQQAVQSSEPPRASPGCGREESVSGTRLGLQLLPAPESRLQESHALR
uniref:MRG-binding protein n=1 Tax=Ursus maritimus TaxID=29073 RepID=A0A452VBF4_URSMA